METAVCVISGTAAATEVTNLVGCGEEVGNGVGATAAVQAPRSIETNNEVARSSGSLSIFRAEREQIMV